MAPQHTADELVRQIPDFLSRLAALERPDAAAVRLAAAAAGLTPDVEDEPDDDYLLFSYEGIGKEELERRLRPAVTRALGAPSGEMRGWFLGPYEIHATVYRNEVELAFRPGISLLGLRRAAAQWLGGAEKPALLVERGFSFFLHPGVRPPGDRSAGDDERYANTLTFLAGVGGARRARVVGPRVPLVRDQPYAEPQPLR